MRIGIFGDSFANLKFEENTTPTWVDILSTKYNVTNHAVSGSNLYYSIDLIQKYHLEYDKIILVVTQPGRLKLSKRLSLGEQEQFIVGMLDEKVTNLNNFKDNKKVAYEAAAQYFLYLQDSVYDNYIHGLMLKDIVRSKEDIIFVPAFKDSWHGNNFSIHQIYLKENEYWNIARNAICNYTDIRNCHMTAENNAIFATKAKEWLNDKPVHIDLNDFVTTTNKDFYLKQK